LVVWGVVAWAMVGERRLGVERGFGGDVGLVRGRAVVSRNERVCAELEEVGMTGDVAEQGEEYRAKLVEQAVE